MSTTTERPAKRYFRSAPAKYNYLRSLKSAFRQMFVNAKRFAWTHEFMLDKRAELLDGKNCGFDNALNSHWRKLAGSEQAEMFGYWEALSDSLLDALEFRYLVNGKWYTPSEVCARKDGTDPARDIPSPYTNGHYVHTVNTENGPEYRIWS